ncbi:MAG: 5-formyltetrahydrofolate cyclo-ligase [Desulforhopalus sp.]
MKDGTQMRKDSLAARNSLSQEHILAKSLAVQDRLLGLDEIRRHQSIFVYVSFRSEVATLGLIDSLIKLGKSVTVPITRVDEKRLDAIRITDRAADLEPGYCGIPEPRELLCSRQRVPPEEIETILLPGSVFDERGGRFGYGGGYYDRFLAAVPAATRIGLAFDLQVVPRAPLQEHDELLDLVVTESRVIYGNR